MSCSGMEIEWSAPVAWNERFDTCLPNFSFMRCELGGDGV